MYTFSCSRKQFDTDAAAMEYINSLVKCNRCFDIFKDGKLWGTAGFGELRVFDKKSRRNNKLCWDKGTFKEATERAF